MKAALSLLMTLSLLLPGNVSAQEEFQKAKFSSNVTATVSRIKSTKIEGGDYDDKTERLTFKIVIKNPTTVTFSGVTMEFFLFGQSMVNTKAYKLMQLDKQTVSLEALKTLEVQTPEVVSMWDSTDAVFGEKYKGWFLRLRAPDGTLLVEKSTSSFFSNTDALKTAEVGKFYDKALNPLPKP